MERLPHLLALHELAHCASYSADPRVERARIRYEPGFFVAEPVEVPMSEFTGSRPRYIWAMAAGIVAEWLYRFRTREEPPLLVAALFYGETEMFLGTPYGAGDAEQLRPLLELGDKMETARTIFQLATMLWPLARDCDEAVLAMTSQRIRSLEDGEFIEFDTGRELMELAGISGRRH